MDELQSLRRKVDLLHEKQNEIIDKMNKVISKLNSIPHDIEDEKEMLSKKAAYFEQELERLKLKMNMPDENI